LQRPGKAGSAQAAWLNPEWRPALLVDPKVNTMFKKILIANRGENRRAAAVSAQPNCMVRAAHAGDFSAMELSHV